MRKFTSLRALFALGLVALCLLVGHSSSARAMQLIMFEQEACEWCEAWNKEVGVVYHKTPEGKMAPLRRVDIFDPRPKDIKHINSGHFTPTFVLIDQGKEIGRIRGYPGEDFFWGMLDELLNKYKKKKAKQAKSDASPS